MSDMGIDLDSLEAGANNTNRDTYGFDADVDLSPDEYLSGGVKGNICSDQLDRFSAYSKLSSQQTRVEVTVKGIWKTE